MYELWELVSYGHMEPFHPGFLVSKKESFYEIHLEFLEKIKSTPCVIIYNNERKN